MDFNRYQIAVAGVASAALLAVAISTSGAVANTGATARYDALMAISSGTHLKLMSAPEAQASGPSHQNAARAMQCSNVYRIAALEIGLRCKRV
ncbi:MAG: hypothetical protein AAFQ45_02745 [Pseudomonadota bacterium]